MIAGIFTSFPPILICFVVFGGMILFSFLGFTIGRWYYGNKEHDDNSGPAEGSIYAILGLLLAFTFSMAGNHYDQRKYLILEEANCISTVILRCDLYPDSIAKPIKSHLKNYLDSRINYYQSEGEDRIQELKNANEVFENIWTICATSSKKPELLIASGQMIPALNAMNDIVTSRDAARTTHVPGIINWMLIALAYLASFYSGFQRSSKLNMNRISIVLFALLTSMVFYLILDLDRSKSGFVRNDHEAKYIEELHELLK
jgi:hypothetical protein